VAAAGRQELVRGPHEEFAQVNGELPIISLRPHSRPQYSSTVGVELDEWLSENHDDLVSWYQQTAEAIPEQHPEDFRQFCLVQFEIAEAEDHRLHDALYEAQTRDADNDDEP